jgi:hypothetical protein
MVSGFKTLILFHLGIPTIYTGDALNRLTQVLDPLLGRLKTATSWFENEPHADTQAGEHVDERVSAEEVDPAPKQITHPRLRYTENFGRLGLLETSGRD